MNQNLDRTKKVNFRDLVDIPSTTYATYGPYRYPAKFIPHVVAYVLENYGNSESDVFDPFAGYGTAGIVLRVYGHSYEIRDLNPLLKTLRRIATLELKDMNVKSLIKNKSTLGKLLGEGKLFF